MPHSTGGTTILVVEERFVSDFLRSVLSQRGYEVNCLSVTNAVALLEREGTREYLLITNSPQHFRQFPSLPVLYMASCPDPVRIEGFDRSCTLSKPFHPRLLFECLGQLLS